MCFIACLTTFFRSKHARVYLSISLSLIFLSACADTRARSICADTTGTVVDARFDTEAYGTLSASVYLPPCYDQTDAHYPVLYLLHGGGASRYSWFTLGAGTVSDTLIGNAELAPMIIVSPTVKHDWDGQQYADTLVQTIVPAIDTDFRTRADRTQRGIAGMSAGGSKAAFIGLLYPDTFGAVGIYSGPVLTYGATKVETLLSADPMPALYLDVGESDGFLPQHVALHELLIARDIEHIHQVRPGAHIPSFWANALDTYLRWFNAVFTDQ